MQITQSVPYGNAGLEYTGTLDGVCPPGICSAGPSRHSGSEPVWKSGRKAVGPGALHAGEGMMCWQRILCREASTVVPRSGSASCKESLPSVPPRADAARPVTVCLALRGGARHPKERAGEWNLKTVMPGPGAAVRSPVSRRDHARSCRSPTDCRATCGEDLPFRSLAPKTHGHREKHKMIVGILKEIKQEENRVCMTPGGVEVMKMHGHTVLVEKNAGSGSGFTDEAYAHAGAKLVDEAELIYKRSEMVMHVKEPLHSEFDLIREDQIVFTYLHLAADEELTGALIKSKSVSIAYETIQKADGSLPLLTPMSEVAGRMAIQQGAKYLEMAQGGQGILLGGVPGVDPGTVVVIGGGSVGTNAAKMACGLGAKVYLLDKNLDRLRHLSDFMPKNCFLLHASPVTVRELVTKADVVVGAVLVPGAKTPRLVTREMLKSMKKGAVLVDVAIDQGGCFETSRPTTHSNPTYVIDGVVHYCVSNMPGGVAKTSTLALTNATLPYALEIADKGWKKAMRENPEIKLGANVVQGKVTCSGVAEAFGLDLTPIDDLLN